MGLIYMRTSPSGGRYIGQTVFTEEKRWEDHIKEAKCKDYENLILNRAIIKYGPETFIPTILEDNICDEDLDAREIYWIDYYKTYYLDGHHGYNMTRGGSGRMSAPTKKILELWNEGYNLIGIAKKLNICYKTVSIHLKNNGITSEEIMQRGCIVGANLRSQRYKESLKLDSPKVLELWNNGECLSSIATNLNIRSDKIKKILLQNNITNEDIKNRAIINSKKTFLSNMKQTPFALSVMSLWNDGLTIKEIAQQLKVGLTPVTNILELYNVPKTERYCRGAQKANNYRNKPILQYDINNNFIREWPSAAEAGRQLKIDASGIRKACKGTLKTCGNFIWKNKDLTN